MDRAIQKDYKFEFATYYFALDCIVIYSANAASNTR